MLSNRFQYHVLISCDSLSAHILVTLSQLLIHIQVVYSSLTTWYLSGFM